MTVPASEASRDRTEPPTAALVLAVLRERDAASQGDLVEATGRSRRAIRDAVAELTAEGEITATFNARDARRRRYELAE